MIIATAGHVDHGKTELIKALTGTDTDRLPEEKVRGLSIDLGFVYQPLSNNKTLGFVDVPGHEKFIRNMLAGVNGIDLGLLVIAADDGVMPQTREHFAILNLLGIDQYVVAITKIDRVDTDRVQEVQDQVKALLLDAGLDNDAAYPVCAPKLQGVEILKQALHARGENMAAQQIKGHFRLGIDRVFTKKGIGLVVTGMVFAGIAKIDENLVVSSNGSLVRVRGIHALNTKSDHAKVGERCAMNISGRGISEDTVRRGNWLMHSFLYVPTRRIDVDLRVLGSESRALKHWTPVHLHLGTGRIAARVAVLERGSIAPGELGLAQLVLEQDAFVVHRDRFVLRDQSAKRTIAGGHVINPFSPKRGRARDTRIAALRAMNHRGPNNVLEALTDISEIGVSLDAFSVSYNLTQTQIDTIVESLELIRVGKPQAQRVFSQPQWLNLLERIEHTISHFHETKPEQPGAHLRDIQIGLKPYVETPVLDTAIRILFSEKRLNSRGSRFHLPTHEIQIREHDQKIWMQAKVILATGTGSPPSLHQAARCLNLDKKVLEKSFKSAVKVGEMVMIAKNRYIPTNYAARLAHEAERIAKNSEDGYFTVVQYCAQTELGRNFAIDLLEYLDKQGFTERLKNQRRIKRPAANVFAIDDV